MLNLKGKIHLAHKLANQFDSAMNGGYLPSKVNYVIQDTSENISIESAARKSYYKAALDNGLTEHEFDHVFIGTCTSRLNPDSDEVADYAYLDMGYLKNHIERYPEKYTVWFKIAFPLLEEFMSNRAQ